VLTEINTAICQLDTITQQNAALVEQGMAAAELERRASDLTQAVIVFCNHPVANPTPNLLERPAVHPIASTKRPPLTLVTDRGQRPHPHPHTQTHDAPMLTATGT